MDWQGEGVGKCLHLPIYRNLHETYADNKTPLSRNQQMAGVKGRSGGPRANSGGARPGAGRKPAPAIEPELNAKSEPLQFLLAVMRGEISPSPEQLKAATAAAQYMHAKKEGGKKDETAEKAKKAASKFAPAAAPLKLVSR